MNLTELQQEVYLITNRPDLVAQTLAAVQSATLFLHTYKGEFFAKDLDDVGIAFTSESINQQLEYRVLLPQFRGIKYFRRTDSTGQLLVKPFELITPEEVLDSYSQYRANVAYIAGEVLNIRSSVAFQYGIMGYYKFPIVTSSGYSSWIAQEYPFAIIYKAAEVILKSIGKTEEFAAIKLLRDEQVTNLVNSNIQPTAY
jgi:hypothetical protein